MTAQNGRTRGAPTVRVTEIGWDADRAAYHGVVIFSGPSGLSMLRVAAPGRPGWDHSHVAAVLTAAGRARGGDLCVGPAGAAG